MGLSQQVIRLLPTHVAIRNAQLCRVRLLKAEPNDNQLSLGRQFSEIREALRENACQNKGPVSQLKLGGRAYTHLLQPLLRRHAVFQENADNDNVCVPL